MDTLNHTDPFAGMSPEQIYALLANPPPGLPRWPGEPAQKHYTGGSGPFLVRRTLNFIAMLDGDGAFAGEWKGLDYGAGWGRIASLLLSKGPPEKLDLVDAWAKSLDLLEAGRFRNRRWAVSEVLKDGELPADTYTFVFSFSVFSHLAEHAFWNNIERVVAALRPGGTFYFTVRGRDFLLRRYPELADTAVPVLDREGFYFTPTKGNLGAEPIFGEAIVTPEYIEERARHLGALRHIGNDQWQQVYALRKGSV